MGGSLEYSEIIAAQSKNDNYKNIRFFVETGTYKGATAMLACKHFEHVFTAEIVEKLYQESKDAASKQNLTNIDFYLGDSVILLANIVPKVTDGAIFFIDAHQSGPETSNNGKQVPLMEELDVILSHKLGHSVFIFDDIRFWPKHSTPAWDWLDVTCEDIIAKFARNGYIVNKSYEHNDRFIVLAYHLSKLL